MNKITVKAETIRGCTTFQGFVDNNMVVSISNNINGLYFTVGSSSCLPSDFVRAKAYSDCIAQTIKAVEEHTFFKNGDRVVVKSGCFSSGSRGTIVFIEPGHDSKIWVQRDGAGQPCFYYTSELDKE